MEELSQKGNLDWDPRHKYYFVPGELLTSGEYLGQYL